MSLKNFFTETPPYLILFPRHPHGSSKSWSNTFYKKEGERVVYKWRELGMGAGGGGERPERKRKVIVSKNK